MKMRIAFLLLVLCGCMACTPTVSNKAQNLLDKATSHYTKGEYHTAKILVDSIHTQFPREIALRKQARILMFNIEYQETMRNVMYLDSIMPLIKQQWDSMAVDYVLLDTTLVEKKTYQHKKLYQQAPTTTLSCEVTELGELNLISINAANARNHVAVKVCADDVFADTQEVGINNVYNNRFTDLGIQWEYVTFDKTKQGEVPGFIELYADKTILVRLVGEKSYSYYLPKPTAKAIAASANFARQTALRKQIETEHRKSTEKLSWIKQKLVEEESPY
jgi:hypothetical protein